MDLIVEDNFFDDPDELRKIALSMDDYRINEDPESPIGWKGMRTRAFRYYNDNVLNSYSQKVYDYVYDALNFSKNFDKDQMMISSCFHISTEQTRKGFLDFWIDRFHKDFLPCAGIVYLTPNAPENTGTSILDGPNDRIVRVENIYNRLVAYDGYYVHGPTNLFGSNKENGRMTFTFFIHETDDDIYSGEFV